MKKPGFIWKATLSVCIYVLLIASIYLFYTLNILATAIILVLCAVALGLWHTKQDIVFFVVGAILGPLGEIICIYGGAWTYTNPTFLGIPVWLPLAWGLITMALKRIAEGFVEIKWK